MTSEKLVKTTVWMYEGVHERAKELGINVAAVCREAEMTAVINAERNRIALERAGKTYEEIYEAQRKTAAEIDENMKKFLSPEDYAAVQAEWKKIFGGFKE